MASELRELLFGDVPIGQWAGESSDEPWTLFQDAARAIAAGDPAAATAALRTVLARPDLESRHTLQAWNVLRELGATPDAAEAGHLYGVVLDVPLAQGYDTVAAYEDHTARYLNQGGGAIVWDSPELAMDALIDAVLTAARPLLAKAGVWEGARPPLTPGLARVSLLTADGLHFGQAAFDQLLQDPEAGPAFRAGAMLMSTLIERSQGHR